MTCSWLVHDLFMTCSWHVHNLRNICLWFSITTFFCNFTNSFELLHFHCFSWSTSLPYLNYFTYLTWTILLKTYHSKYLTSTTLFPPLPYFPLFSPLLQNSEFTKSDKLNRLACLSLAQLSPSLLFTITWTYV